MTRETTLKHYQKPFAAAGLALLLSACGAQGNSGFDTSKDNVKHSEQNADVTDAISSQHYLPIALGKIARVVFNGEPICIKSPITATNKGTVTGVSERTPGSDAGESHLVSTFTLLESTATPVVWTDAQANRVNDGKVVTELARLPLKRLPKLSGYPGEGAANYFVLDTAIAAGSGLQMPAGLDAATPIAARVSC